MQDRSKSYCDEKPLTVRIFLTHFILGLQKLPNLDEVKILRTQINFGDRKSRIKYPASRAFFPTCLLPCTRRSHGRHIRLASLVHLPYVSTYCVPKALLHQNKPFRLLHLGHAQIITDITMHNNAIKSLFYELLHKTRAKVPPLLSPVMPNSFYQTEDCKAF